jgi:CheY-like chemotaxis protein
MSQFRAIENPPKGRAVPRILVIDDQKHVRTAIVLALQARGLDVVGTESGQSGLTKFEQSEFDLVIADIFMPGVDGVTLIKALRERHPGLPVIAMSGVLLGGSGRTALDHLTNIAELADVICLQKPFRPSDLVQAVAAALAAGAAPAGTATPAASSASGHRRDDLGSDRPV